ncbi:unnamed protein product, partial [Pylaiella littoralis]
MGLSGLHAPPRVCPQRSASQRSRARRLQVPPGREVPKEAKGSGEHAGGDAWWRADPGVPAARPEHQQGVQARLSGQVHHLDPGQLRALGEEGVRAEQGGGRDVGEGGVGRNLGEDHPLVLQG